MDLSREDVALRDPAVARSLDPVLAEAVDDALSGPPTPTSSLDPQRVLGADPHDFAGLYLRHRSSFAAQARRFLRDPRDVDEVVQESFLRLFLALPELSSELQALAYCRRTITNLCIDRYRADQRRPRLVDLESVPADVLSDDEPDDPVIQAEDAAIVREALALLSPLHRQALLKREVEEKPLPQIAAELDVPEDSVKHLLHRARRALRRRLVETRTARGLDAEDHSTLSLLARSAVTGTQRAGMVVVALAGLTLLLGGPKTPAEALQTVSALIHDAVKAAPTPARRTPAVRPAPVVVRDTPGPDALPQGVDRPGPVVARPAPVDPEVTVTQAPRAAPVPLASPVPSRAASGTVTTTVTPAPVPTPTEGATDGLQRQYAAPPSSSQPTPTAAPSGGLPD